MSQSARALCARLRQPQPEQRPEWDLSEYLELSMEDLMTEERRKKVFVNVPLTFKRPNGMAFPDGGKGKGEEDLTSKYFKMS